MNNVVQSRNRNKKQKNKQNPNRRKDENIRIFLAHFACCHHVLSPELENYVWIMLILCVRDITKENGFIFWTENPIRVTSDVTWISAIDIAIASPLNKIQQGNELVTTSNFQISRKQIFGVGGSLVSLVHTKKKPSKVIKLLLFWSVGTLIF